MAAAVAVPLLADQVTLTNGDRISGSVVKFDGKNLVLKSDLAGEVTIPWTAVTGITSAAPLTVGLKGGQVLVGNVQASGTEVDVATENAGKVTAPRESVVFIRSKGEQAAYEEHIRRFENPRLIDLWVGNLDLGFAQSKGNADSQTFNLSAAATRATTRDKMSAYYTSIYSKGQIGSDTAVTANAKRGGLSYSLNIAKKWFAFGSVDLESDEFQSLDLRFVPAGGIGYHLISTDTTVLDLQAGGALNREFFSNGLNRTHGEALLGQTFTHKFNKATSVQQRFFFYPGFSNSGNRMNFDTSLVTAVRKWFSWQFAFSDRYLSDPLPGRKSNDTLFTTGARLTFTK